MKKQLIYLASLFTLSAAILALAPGCSKDDDPKPGVSVTSVTSWSGTLNNNSSSNTDKRLDVINKVFVTNENFDLAYGNGAATGNEQFIGGPTSASIQSDYDITSASNQSVFFLLPAAEQAKFDTLVNKLAVTSIASKGSQVSAPAAIGTESFRIRKADGLATGLVFVVKLRAQTNSPTWAIAKITSGPTGDEDTGGSVGISLKW